VAGREEIEALVVGGGPVGLVTAIALRQQGIDVLVLDSRTPPIDKACGEGIMPDGVACLGELGVDLAACGGRPFVGIRYLDDDLAAEARFPAAPGIAVRRPRFHRALVARAEECGVRLAWGRPVRGLTARGVSTDGGEIGCRWLLAADGLRSRVRSWAGLEGKRSQGRFGIRRHYRCQPWTDHVEVYWAEGGAEAYVTPVSEEEVGVALLWPGPKGSFDELLLRFPALQARLAGARASSVDLGAGPLERRVRVVATDRVALVGDAAGYVDAITGEGLTVGFKQAQALAEAVHAGDLGLYRRAHRRIQRVPWALTRALLAIERRPKLRHRFVSHLGSHPELFERLLEVHVGSRPIGRLGLTPTLRLGWELLTGAPA